MTSEHKLPHDHGNAALDEQLMACLEDGAAFDAASGVFKQLSDGSRLRIFWLLCHCEECVINISHMVGMTSPAVSHHLRQLKNSQLIVSRREGKEVYYRAADVPESRLLHQVIERIIEISCPR